jgi:hypothetical protein
MLRDRSCPAGSKALEHAKLFEGPTDALAADMIPPGHREPAIVGR